MAESDHAVSAAAERPWLVVAGGGTAGHVVPGLVVADELVRRGHDRSSITFVGSRRGIETRLVPDAGYRLIGLGGRGIERKVSLAGVTAVFGVLGAMVRAFVEMVRHRPAVAVALGGYASVPCAVSAAVLRVPLIVMDQNARAGLANRLVGRVAKVCAVPFADTDLPRKVVTGNPVRAEFLTAREMDRAVAKAAMSLPTDRLAIVVMTGSLGSKKINEAVVGLVDRWAARSELAIFHVVGRRDFDDLVTPSGVGERTVTGADDDGSPRHIWSRPDGLTYVRVAYEDDMATALAAADFAVCRSGGTTVAELAVIGVPAVLVPLPIATRDHQRHNAADLVSAGAAVLIDDADVTVDSLAAAIEPILDDGPRRDRMRVASRSVGHPAAASEIADLVETHAKR